MAQLFGTGTIKSHTEILQGFDESKISLIKKLHQDWKNGLLAGETEYEQTFNQLFFGELLGYENRINRIPKGAVIGTGIADLTLGYFDEGKYSPDDIQIVCELKGAKTNLVKKQFGHGGLSAVGQGFSYKTGLKNCKRLIVSNFYEIRLYRDNQTDFEVWTLDELIDPKDNYSNLRKLYLLLHRENLLAHTGKSKTEDLLSHFREEQKEITVKFYKEYKQLRIELINDIKQHNPGISIEILIEKAQKIIDRLIFIFFCEDKGLLPDKKLKENIVRSREAGFSAWEVTKKFFGLIDKGSEQLGIPSGYNGGLFQKDDVLDNLEIGDSICKKFTDMTNYDFDDKLSVNVLGHIFEQSISDLENLKIDLLGQEVETGQLADTGKGRRKKDGIFYTPEYIVDYIVQNSVMKYLNEKEDELIKKYRGEKNDPKLVAKAEIEAYQAYQNILQNIKVLDPACGSGAFLVRVFDVLFEENKRVGSILNSLFDESETYKNILTNNIYGVDLNEESVEITKLSLWLKSAQKGKKLNNLDGNIKCGNSLIDDVFIAREKAFDWNVQFKEIMKNGGFNVIVGNPPYVRTQNLDKNSKSFFDEKYKVSYKNYDIYILFVEKAFSLLESDGVCSYIMPKKFINTDYGEKFKMFLYENNFIDSFVDFGTNQIFGDATTYTGIFVFTKGIKKTLNYKNIDDLNQFPPIGFDSINYSNLSGKDWILTNPKEKELFGKLQKESFLGEFTDRVFQGLVTGVDGIYIMEQKGNNLFSKENGKSYTFDCDIVFPLLKGTEIKRYSTPSANYKIIFPYKIVDGKAILIDEETMKNKYAEIYNYLKEFEIKLRTREGGKFDNQNWYSYSRNQNIALMPSKKILTQVLSNHSSLTLDEAGKYFFVGGGTAGGYGISIDSNGKLDYKYLLTLLNSSLLEWFLHKYASPFNGGYYAYSRATMEKLPIKEIPLSDQQPFVERADKMLALNKDLYELTGKFLHRIQDNLKIEKLTKKLEKFYELDFKYFLIELKKQKVLLTLAQQDEREPYFKECKEKILALKGEIERTDKEIDDMVFDLYGLSEEERKVVFNG